ncbi:hypothetical protein [Dietzia sp. PP-33]|jgi:hypothetical protein|uniref:hypothetical protein n=1 Tax=Dietzia sp. PP-33 TaxID=2957500 RepID=UPI0029B1C0D0|nr:hypothetical protein [Dietzia sp. PP-33]MDX2356880.1 hypothetical protein [Dietzia sp. PP-33]
MDLTGSIMEASEPVFETVYGSFMDAGGTGSAFIDTLATAPAYAFNLLLMFVGGLGGDLGSTGSAGAVM